MTRTRTTDAGQYSFRQRASAFFSGLADFEPLVSVAREGLRQEGLGQDRRVNYALRIAESRSSSCGEIARLIRQLGAPSSDPYTYRTSPLRSGIPPHVQDRMCELYRARYDSAMEALLAQERGMSDPANASHIVEARMASRLDKARTAYDLLKMGAIDSSAARRHLTAVFCDAARDVLAGGLTLFHGDACVIRDAVIREFNGEGIRGLIPFGISAYEAGRILTAVSEALCGADMSFVPPRR